MASCRRGAGANAARLVDYIFTVSIFDDLSGRHMKDTGHTLFELEMRVSLGVRKVYFSLNEVLVLYSSGRTTGLVVFLARRRISNCRGDRRRVSVGKDCPTSTDGGFCVRLFEFPCRV